MEWRELTILNSKESRPTSELKFVVYLSLASILAANLLDVANGGAGKIISSKLRREKWQMKKDHQHLLHFV